jgi:serine/threonine protein kinase
MSSRVQGVGADSYISPELRESHHHTLQSDIFALGCILWEISSGAPFHRDDRAPHAWPKSCQAPPPFQELVNQCWLEADRRPTCTTIVQQLEEMAKPKQTSSK